MRRPSFLTHFGEECPSDTRPKRECILASFANFVSRVEAAYFHVVQMHSFPLRPSEKRLHTGHYGIILYRAALLIRGCREYRCVGRFSLPCCPINHLHPDCCFVRFFVPVSSSVCSRRVAPRLAASISLCRMPPQVSHLFCLLRGASSTHISLCALTGAPP